MVVMSTLLICGITRAANLPMWTNQRGDKLF